MRDTGPCTILTPSLCNKYIHLPRNIIIQLFHRYIIIAEGCIKAAVIHIAVYCGAVMLVAVGGQVNIQCQVGRFAVGHFIFISVVAVHRFQDIGWPVTLSAREVLHRIAS